MTELNCNHPAIRTWIVQQVLNGVMCEICGHIFDCATHEGIGYPAVCSDCWDTLSRRKRWQYRIHPKYLTNKRK